MNQPKYTSIFGHEKYIEFINNEPFLQEYWNEPMYVRYRPSDGYREVCSNIQIGDYFGLGKTTQIGIITHKITHIQVSIPEEKQRSSPAGQGGNYLSYGIHGDVGGHWSEQLHTEMIRGHFIWLPTPERLLWGGYDSCASSLQRIMYDIILELREINDDPESN